MLWISNQARLLYFFLDELSWLQWGAVCDLKKNKMCLINVDEAVFYDPVEKKKSEEFISSIEMFEDLAPPANSNREPAKPASPSVDIQPSA